MGTTNRLLRWAFVFIVVSPLVINSTTDDSPTSIVLLVDHFDGFDPRAFISALPRSISVDRDEVYRFLIRSSTWNESKPIPLRVYPSEKAMAMMDDSDGADDVLDPSLGAAWVREDASLETFFSIEEALLQSMETTGATRNPSTIHRGATTTTTTTTGWTYHSYEQMTTFMNDLHGNHSNITRLFSIGQSVLGRELWVLCIETDREASTRYPMDDVLGWGPRPRFKWVGNMHGDETVGREALLRLAQYVLEALHHQGDAHVSSLLGDTEVCILPSMNPDGFEAMQRSNANGVDLNRAFPDFHQGDEDSMENREPEVQAVMAWTRGERFMLSANLHGGALVANYPMDNNADGANVYTASLDDELFVHLARSYSMAHPTMHQSGVFKDGITNGADWYPITGGMQDWVYTYQKGWELTIEMSTPKFPASSALDGYLTDHLPAMMAYMAQSHTCVYGWVTDADTGEPIDAAISGAGQEVPTYRHPPIKGTYIRPLPPPGHSSSITIEAGACGYCVQQAHVQVVAQTPQRVDFRLVRCDNEGCESSSEGTSPASQAVHAYAREMARWIDGV